MIISDILHAESIGDFSWYRAGLCNLFVTFKAVSEPAPTGYGKLFKNLTVNCQLSTVNYLLIVLQPNF
ncbi:MAG: hypothetical protein HC894_23500 [Microcoleus sp. SM1_3_4]|nr:hypothetical protein [Microcoleus sp. SM1_3_4]